MQQAIDNLIVLAATLTPAILALFLTNFISDTSEKGLGLVLFGLMGTALIMVIGFGAEIKARHDHQDTHEVIHTILLTAGFFCLCVLLGFLTSTY